jgi:transcriptional regulator with XRE-family HTH domain
MRRLERSSTRAELARHSGISTTGLNNIENGVADPKASTLKAIQATLEKAGVEFTSGAAPGVRLRKGPKAIHPRQFRLRS